jgi:pimeloyl-ACP methyl ester carboxylesterase
MTMCRRETLGLFVALLVAVGALLVAHEDGVVTVDHYVRVKSIVPVMSGQVAQIYVRERVNAGTLARRASRAGRVVLFVHGAGTPAEVAFDVPHDGYSWMGYLAGAGFDTFAMDTTGYGRSTRPTVMNDPCNLPKDRRADFMPASMAAACEQEYTSQLTTIASDWADIGAVVDYVRALRNVDRVSLVAWSLGGPRAGGYAGQHPDKVDKLVLLAPAYNRGASGTPPAKLPPDGTPFTTQSHDEFVANWDRQVGCPAQYEQSVSDAVWSAMLQSDPVGATWGPGVRRAPQTTTWGWNLAMVAKTLTPTLMVAGIHDKQVPPERVRDLYADLGAREKVLVDLGCSSHNAMWEKNREILFQASLEWLTLGSVNGAKDGIVRLGY